MSLGRLRRGELVALVGALGLLIVLFLDWFGVDAGPQAGVEQPLAGGGILNVLNTFQVEHLRQSGWGALGWVLDALLILSIAGGLAVGYVTVRRAAPAWPVGASILTIVLAGVTFLVLLVRVTIAQPGLGVGLDDGAVTVQLPAYVGLLFAALIPAGAWMALGDERLDAPESAYTPPPARPIPGT